MTQCILPENTMGFYFHSCPEEGLELVLSETETVESKLSESNFNLPIIFSAVILPEATS